jgi:transcriptional regulator with XRE-family HTH domain
MYQVLKKWRKDAKITQKQLAEKLSISPSILSNFERGKNEVTFELLEQIAKICEKTLSLELFSEIKMITHDVLNQEIIPSIVKGSDLIALDEEDIQELSVLEGNAYFLKTTNPRLLDEALDLFVNIYKAKGVIAQIRGGADFSYDHVEIFANHIQNYENEHTEILFSCGADGNVKEFEISICAFGMDE